MRYIDLKCTKMRLLDILAGLTEKTRMDGRQRKGKSSQVIFNNRGVVEG